ncbi:hypothetical protein RJ639_045149 [Escallonia herrerae]|uniref:Complex 1 LYR protein domain-containing protein n=1 Tax=Escallonia herrerae TaxID=1293975 RepID=A0AA88W6Z5_9ASTE|nr:hypothetical protein RJ639_045149 [Escallonia herrerae]
MAIPPPSRSEILALFRSFLRTARQYTDYNIREYTKRRTSDAFRRNGHISHPAAAAAAFSDGKSQLEVARRQAVVYSLYAPKGSLPLEKVLVAGLQEVQASHASFEVSLGFACAAKLEDRTSAGVAMRKRKIAADIR